MAEARRDVRPDSSPALAPAAKCGPGWVHHARTSLVQAKAHLSELVDAAEHKGKAVLILRHGKPAAAMLILRHGKPAAAIVPVDAIPGLRRAATRPMNAEEARAFMDERIASGPPTDMTLEDALGRERLDRFGR